MSQIHNPFANNNGYQEVDQVYKFEDDDDSTAINLDQDDDNNNGYDNYYQDN